jgi:hypothetical protein
MSSSFPNVDDALTLYVACHGQSTLVLAPDFQNVPTLVAPAAQLLKAAYLEPHEISGDELRRASERLNNPWPLLILFRSSLDGPPFRTGSVYCPVGEQVISWRADSVVSHGLRVHTYMASVSTGDSGWTRKARVGEEVGYFLTGGPQSSDLWRVTRYEVGLANKWAFTFSPVRLAIGLPHVQFTTINDTQLRAEAEQHWSEFQNHLVGHQYYALVTSAKNLAETLLAYHLSEGAVPFQRDFSKMLDKLADLLRAQPGKPLRFDFLSYHLMQKMRLLHARTHAGRVVTMGRAMRPEFAMTIAEDLIEVLLLAGCAS